MKKNLTSYLAVATATALCLLGMGSAFAAPEGQSESEMGMPHSRDNRSAMKPSFGLYGGGATQNGGLYRADPSMMVDVGFQPLDILSVAVQGQYNPSSLDAPGPKVEFNTSNLLLKSVLNVGGTIPVIRNSYVGAKVGGTMYSGDVETISHFSAGPTVGFDIPLSTANAVTLGAEGTYLAVLGDSELTPDQTSVLGAVRYWF